MESWRSRDGKDTMHLVSEMLSKKQFRTTHFHPLKANHSKGKSFEQGGISRIVVLLKHPIKGSQALLIWFWRVCSWGRL